MTDDDMCDNCVTPWKCNGPHLSEFQGKSEPSLTDFLLARIAEDEQRARDLAADAMVGAPWKHYPEDAYNELQSMALTLAHRTKVDAQVKRRIVDVAKFAPEGSAGWGFRKILRLLALPYADHPDYDPDWRP